MKLALCPEEHQDQASVCLKIGTQVFTSQVHNLWRQGMCNNLSFALSFSTWLLLKLGHVQKLFVESEMNALNWPGKYALRSRLRREGCFCSSPRPVITAAVLLEGGGGGGWVPANCYKAHRVYGNSQFSFLALWYGKNKMYSFFIFTIIS